ncbi:MAG: hypothetical protein M3R70_07535 [Actinomycetota bacterium]|nr:hypothetical protein [Actinomycetota bacterium]
MKTANPKSFFAGLAAVAALMATSPARAALGRPAPESPANGAAMQALPAFAWAPALVPQELDRRRLAAVAG